MLSSFRGCVLASSFLLARANRPVSLQQVFQDERYQVRASGPNIGPQNGGFLDVIGPLHTASNGQRFINMVEQGRDGFMARSPKYRPSRNSQSGGLAHRD